MSIYYANETERAQKMKSGFSGHDGNASLFTSGQLDQLASIMNIRKYDAGAYLFWEGDPADSVYLVRKGLVKLRKSTDDGKDLLLSILQPNDLLADIDAWDTTHRYSAQAMEAVEVGVVSRLQLELLMSKSGEFAFRFAMWMSLMHRLTESKLRDLLMLGKQGALASTLIRLSNSFGIVTEEGILIDIKLTNTEMAELVGTTRESVNRMLGALKDDGVIQVAGGGMIRILQIDELRSIAGCPDCPACPKEMCRI
ncbi:Crp/Fnr family transcriptional regulator [Paenibacillus sambharensis]|uniref:Crp/Fnr family transcriptional regulator n=1 Tax=Paenibacillus sambharensis TaxID=1803190 RepID=A0A2W1L9P8_9BACL|nr:Crp/Fnr family transcriptional regulator [Paenibacillus sambharensis]PZD95479.1 Crp/Fnr family transcriptional regulator [Paenibacillus sambharensis]